MEDVVDGMQADREPDVIVRDPGGHLLVHGELRVSRRRRVDHQTLRIAHVREQAVKFESVYEPLAGLQAALDAEAEDRAEHALPVILAGEVVGRMVGETRVVYPVDLLMAPQELRDGVGVLRVTLHPQRQRLETLQKEEAVEGAQGRAVVAEPLDARFEYVGELAKGRVELEAMVGRVRLGQLRETA